MGSVQLPIWQGHPDGACEQLATVKARMVNMVSLVSLVEMVIASGWLLILEFIVEHIQQIFVAIANDLYITAITTKNEWLITLSHGHRVIHIRLRPEAVFTSDI
jgi:hypothetical protein